MKSIDSLFDETLSDIAREHMDSKCKCTNPSPYNPNGVCAPMMPKGHCTNCGKATAHGPDV